MSKDKRHHDGFNKFDVDGLLTVRSETPTPIGDEWDDKPLDAMEIGFVQEAVRSGNAKQAFKYIYGDSLSLDKWDDSRVTAEAIKLLRRPPVQELYIKMTKEMTNRMQVDAEMQKATIANLIAYAEANILRVGKNGDQYYDPKVAEQVLKLMQYQAELYGFKDKDYSNSKFQVQLNFEPNPTKDDNGATT